MRTPIIIAFLLCIFLANAFVVRIKRATHNEYKMCVPEELLQPCIEMTTQETKSNAKITCIAARDRLECTDKIRRREADFEVVDPEDMYIASKIPNGDFTVFEEIRTLEEPEAEFRYEGVAVIRNDLKLTAIDELRGLKSCHTGVGRNVGYKIPLTKLKNMGIIGNLNDVGLSPRENELKAFSTLFSKACIVGQWSPDPHIDEKLKKRYANLCQLCEDPEKCDYPDKYSGYEGALNCLAHNGGDIAWTKVIYVRKFFGLPVGTTPAQKSIEQPNDYSYLCPDGSRVPVTGPPCRWAARPWQGYMTNADTVKTVNELRTKIANLNAVGSRLHAPWLNKVLELNAKTIPKENKIIAPGDYLDKANYTDVVERDYGPPIKYVRFCVTSDDALNKCRDLARAAFSREVRPRFDCVREKSVDNCLATIRDNGADVITLDGGLVDRAQRKYNLKPIVAEQYEDVGGAYYAVAVVRKNSVYKSFSDLRGAKSCHTGFGNDAGYNAPVYALIRKGLLRADQCPYASALAQFFAGGSCLPGVRASINDDALPKETTERLCSLCAGNVDANDGTSLDSKCNADSSESYAGDVGAFRCLVQGQGDVAFVKQDTVRGNTDGRNPDSWAIALKSDDYELLCPDGGRESIDQYKNCNLAHVPPHMVVTSNSKSEGEIEEIQNALVSASDVFTKRTDLFKLFGSYNNKRDLLFKDSATGLKALNEENEAQKEYAQLLSVINGCVKEA